MKKLVIFASILFLLMGAQASAQFMTFDCTSTEEYRARGTCSGVGIYTYDLGSQQYVESVTGSLGIQSLDGAQANVGVSSDGVSWTIVNSATFTVDSQNNAPFSATVQTYARYIKIDTGIYRTYMDKSAVTVDIEDTGTVTPCNGEGHSQFDGLHVEGYAGETKELGYFVYNDDPPSSSCPNPTTTTVTITECPSGWTCLIKFETGVESTTGKISTLRGERKQKTVKITPSSNAVAGKYRIAISSSDDAGSSSTGYAYYTVKPKEDLPNPEPTVENGAISLTCTQAKEYATYNRCWGWHKTHTYDLGKVYDLRGVQGTAKGGPSELNANINVVVEVSPDGTAWETYGGSWAVLANPTKETSISIGTGRSTTVYARYVRYRSTDGYVDGSSLKATVLESTITTCVPGTGATITPETQKLSAGTEAAYTVAVMNRDVGNNCPSEKSYQINMGSYNCAKELSCEQSKQFTLKKGASTKVPISIKSGATTAPGTYTFAVPVWTNGENIVWTYGKYVVESKEVCLPEEASGFPLANALTVESGDFSIDTKGTLSLTVKNLVGRDVYLSQITKGNTAYRTFERLIKDGEKEEIRVENFVSPQSEGTCYSHKIDLVYPTTSGSILIRSTGVISGKYSSKISERPCQKSYGLKADPESITALAGNQKLYTIRVSNKNVGNDCPSTETYDLKIYACPTGWTCDISQQAVVPQGESRSVSLIVESSETASSGKYDVGVTASLGTQLRSAWVRHIIEREEVANPYADAKALLDYESDGRVFLRTKYGPINQYVWDTAFARPSNEKYASLKQYKKISLHATYTGSTYGRWIKHDADSSNIITAIQDSGDWLIFTAGCVPAVDARKYREATGVSWFHTEIPDMSNARWTCGFNKPVSYLPGNGLGLPDGGFETVLEGRVSVDNDASIGPKDAEVTVIEFSDFECPFCSRAYPTVKQMLKEYEGKIRFVYRDFPLSFHPSAQKAAEAAECAKEQGKFWEMHDKIFENQQAIGTTDLKTYAKEFGLDSAKFDSCLDSGKYASEVQKDFQDGSAAGVSGTPTFFIGNDKDGYVTLVGAQPFSVFKQTIDSQLSA